MRLACEPPRMARTSAEPSGYTVLVVDDQAETLRSTHRLLEREGHRVLLASSGQEALDIFRRERIQLLIVDYFMPEMTGEELIAHVRREDETVQILLQTGYAGEKPARQMLEVLDIQGYHDKTDGAERLLLWVGVCLKAHRQLTRVREAERLKGELLANLSHEFRTPLNIALGYVGMLTAGDCGALTPEAHEVLGRVRCNTTSLLSLVNDLLDLSTLETQAAETRLEPLALERLRDDTTRVVESLAGEKPIRLRWEVPPDAPLVRADPAKLRLLLVQLCSHATAGMPAGDLRVHARASHPARLALCVSHPGTMSAAQREALFEPLLQTRTGPAAETGPPTGIGLAVARRLARAMGGDLTVESAAGVGTTFAVTLPVADGARPESAPPVLPG